MSDLGCNPDPCALTADPWFLQAKDQASELMGLVRTAQLPNALLFTGACGTGKSEAALFLAKACNCTGSRDFPCDSCISCKKLNAGMHPDYLCLEPEEAKKNITISQIRDMGRLISARPNEARHRLVFIRQAGLMNVQAQNSLLKVLEEPPDHTFFVLGAEETAPLLPTILSRCRQIRFRQPVPAQVAGQLQLQLGLDSQTARMAVLTLGTDLPLLLTWVNPAWQRHREWLIRQFIGLVLKKGQTVPALALARQLALVPERLDKDLAVIRTAIRDLAVARHFPEKIVNLDFLDAFHDINQMHSESVVLEWGAWFHDTLRRLAANSGPRLTLDRFFLALTSGTGPGKT